ncbi:MAG: tetratricopeptide repeat protein [Candidatus Rokubacteria bacterium]|nr:tetratricopeptide repeat protein [Candidatus Rokubacteria bacterium]
MPPGPRWLAAGAAAAVLALAPGAEARIPLELRFDGQALDPQAPLDFTCFSYTLSRWVACRAQKGDARGAWILERPAPGKYRMHVSIDENPANPRRFPGDYEAQVPFEVRIARRAAPRRSGRGSRPSGRRGSASSSPPSPRRRRGPRGGTRSRRPTGWTRSAICYRPGRAIRARPTVRGERQFFKAAYQGIVAHPDDEHLVATAINLLHYVIRDDYPHRLGLARFGYERYFQHRARTDNCANCMVGDTTQGLVRNLSNLYAGAGRYDEAIAVSRRLIEERAADVSPYKLAETWDQIAWVHWHKGERDRALAVVREALARYGGTVRGDELRRTLAHFERER